jgi:multiple antibiotic resistance protein
MNLFETALILILVTDPFGNLPVVLAVLRQLSGRAYRMAIIRETFLAFVVLVIFALAGQHILDYLNIEQASLSVAGGVILFLISLKMIFSSASHMFEDDYSDNPVLVPIAIPFITGPSAITTTMILYTSEQVSLQLLLIAIALVFAMILLTLLLGHWLLRVLGQRGINAMEKFMGLLLSLISVNMILIGIREFWAQPF